MLGIGGSVYICRQIPHSLDSLLEAIQGPSINSIMPFVEDLDCDRRLGC